MIINNPKKKILFVLQDLELGGAEKLKFIISKYINLEKYDITFCCINKRGTFGEEIARRGGKVIVLDLKDKFYNLTVTYKLYGLVKKIKPDLIHSALFNANFHARLVGILTNIPVIIEEHGMYTWKRWYHIAIDRLLERFTCKIITPSNSVKDFIIKQEKIEPDKIKVIYNCIDLRELKSDISKVEAKKNLNIDAHNFVIGVVGNLRKEKGHSILLQSLRGVISEHPNVKLFILGSGPLYEKLINMSKNLKIEKHVTFMGKVTNIADFLRSLDLFIMPSLNEGFGISLIEAIYMKVPCIASNVGGIKEIAGYCPEINLIEPDNVSILSAAITDKITKRAEFNMASSDQNNIKEIFTPQFYVDRLNDLYGSILS